MDGRLSLETILRANWFAQLQNEWFLPICSDESQGGGVSSRDSIPKSDSNGLGECNLVPEMADPREDHGNAELIGGRDHLFVSDRPPRLDDRGRAGLGHRFQAIGERKEGV